QTPILPILIILAAIFVIRLFVVIPEKDMTELVDGKLAVYFMDVGQADCEIIRLPDSRNIIVDAGKNESADALVKEIKDMGISRFDYVIMTHPHEDHIGGMDSIIKEFDIGKVYMPDVAMSTATFSDVLDSMERKNIKANVAKAGVVMIDEEIVKAEFIAPCSDRYEEINDYSAVLKFTYDGFSFLFTGDAEKISEKEMLENGYDVSADVLKVGHHGSSSSSTYKFIKRVNPQYAVIEVGEDNSYGHPASDVLKRLENTKLYRTDLNGTIVFVYDGKDISIITQKQ
ncbi:MAG: MBL fold metallo-hydrolase, partial [Clostridia bacterium]|nr:MBL fold metallo-hydrolase [Clostridia bacterium]